MADQQMTDQPTPEEDLFPGASLSTPPPSQVGNNNGNRANTSGAMAGSSTSAPQTHQLSAAAGGSGQAQGGTSGNAGTTKHVHEPTGYTWEKDDDAPGYGWQNKKAQEDMARAHELIVDKERTIGRKYGDIGSGRYSK